MEKDKKKNWFQSNISLIVIIVSCLLTVGKILQTITQLQQEVNDLEKAIDKMTDYLNGEDDGVRGDFMAADEAAAKLEEMRDRALQAEMKVWVLENFDK